MANPGPAAPAAGGGGGRRRPRKAANDNYISRLDPTYLQEFRHIQAVSNNFFAYHRLGLSLLPEKPWEDPNRPAPGTTAPARNPAAGDFWDGQYTFDPLGAAERQVRERWWFGNLAGRAARRSDDRANAAARATRRYLRAQGCDISLLEVLGFGGNGVASLFEVEPGRGRARKKVVVKSTLRSGENMRDERAHNRSLKRARHIIQMLSWTRELMDTDGASDDARDRWAQIDGNEGLLTLEYMKNGDVWGFLKKVAGAGERVPNKILWKIFFCLIRACISMKHPPRLRVGPNRGQFFWESSVGPDLNEAVPYLPDGSIPPSLDLVHFDLDTKNILISNFDEYGHQTAPVFKVSDFGLAKTISHPIFDTPKPAWRKRKSGKEQFHKEWEYIDILPRLEQPQPLVAGQYGAWSNIYAIALCMHMLITQAGPPYPPAAFGPMNHPVGDSLLSRPTVFTDYWGSRVEPFYTHGYHLEAEQGLDPELKCLLMRCLADLPADRPTLGELEAWIWAKEALPTWNAPNDGTRAWCEMIFRDAPNAPSSAAEAHPSLATTQPSTPPAPPEVVWDGKDSSGSRAPYSSSSDDDDDGGVALFSGQGLGGP